MFLASLSHNTVRLIKPTSQDIQVLLQDSRALPGEDNFRILLESPEVAYWSAQRKEDLAFLGIVGITKGLATNQIFFKFNFSIYDTSIVFQEVLELVLKYLEYAKLRGSYILQLQNSPFRIKKILERGGFVKLKEDTWVVEL